MERPGAVSYTDTNGLFRFDNLPEGTYTIDVSADRKLYEPVSETVRLIRSSRLDNVTIYLRERTRPESKSGNVVSTAELDRDVPNPAKKEYTAAKRLLAEGKTEQALEHLRRAIELYPSYLMARNDLGVQYLKMNRLPEAREQFEAATEINSKAFNPRLNLGIVMVMQRHYIEALDTLRLADSLDSSSPAVHLYLGIASVEVDELDDAERDLGKALSLGGKEYGVAHFYLGKLHMKKGDKEQAIRELKTYLQDSPAGEEARQAQQLLELLARA
jgi:tetratricopeptide (TPR) repeat protein